MARLSETALRMAAELPPADEAALARWLYAFGRLPRTPAIDRDLGPDDEPMGVLGLDRGGAVRRILEEGFVASADSGWYSFLARPLRTDVVPVCKLYVSPRPESLVEVFPVVAATFVERDVRSFKVGRGSDGLLRPDKIVAYFASRDLMAETADSLDRALSGCPVQGVPFSAELGGRGLLSWGVDPDGGLTRTSWRSWVTHRLAAGLVSRAEEGPDRRVGAALAAIREAGVDPDSWAPAGAHLADGVVP